MADSSSIAMSSIDRVGAPFSEVHAAVGEPVTQLGEQCGPVGAGRVHLVDEYEVGTLYRRNRRHSVSVCPWMPSAPDTTSMA